MSYSSFYFFVEGPSDEDFFKSVIVPCLPGKYDDIHFVKYSKLTSKQQANFLSSVNKMSHADYIYVKDYDSSKNLRSIKGYLKGIFKERIDENKIFIVRREIESWYLAIANPSRHKGFPLNTDDLFKEDVDKYLPKDFQGSVSAYLRDLLTDYNLQSGIKYNSSLSYFYDAMNLKATSS